MYACIESESLRNFEIVGIFKSLGLSAQMRALATNFVASLYLYVICIEATSQKMFTCALHFSLGLTETLRWHIINKSYVIRNAFSAGRCTRMHMHMHASIHSFAHTERERQRPAMTERHNNTIKIHQTDSN